MTDFARRWPHHCKACGGWGGSTFVEMHGFSHGGGETMLDPCDALPATACHRCGEAGLDDDGAGPCKECGWDYDDGIEPADEREHEPENYDSFV